MAVAFPAGITPLGRGKQDCVQLMSCVLFPICSASPLSPSPSCRVSLLSAFQPPFATPISCLPLCLVCLAAPPVPAVVHGFSTPARSRRARRGRPCVPLLPPVPLEVRWMIWEFCLPHRVVELDVCSRDRNRHITDTPSACEFTTTSTTNCAPPTISRVCREVALRHGAQGVGRLRHQSTAPRISTPTRARYPARTRTRTRTREGPPPVPLLHSTMDPTRT